jgi:hypothetical protein
MSFLLAWGDRVDVSLLSRRRGGIRDHHGFTTEQPLNGTNWQTA